MYLTKTPLRTYVAAVPGKQGQPERTVCAPAPPPPPGGWTPPPGTPGFGNDGGGGGSNCRIVRVPREDIGMGGLPYREVWVCTG